MSYESVLGVRVALTKGLTTVTYLFSCIKEIWRWTAQG